MSGVALRSVLGATLVGGMMLPARASDDVLVAAPADARPLAAPPSSAAPGEPAREPPAVLLAYMLDALGHVTKLADAARADRDVIRLNCLDEKRTAIKGLVRISRALVAGAQGGTTAPTRSSSGPSAATSAGVASTTTSSSPAPSAAPGSRLGLDDLVIAQRKCAQLRAEADACIGVLSDYPGGTRLETIVDGPRTADPTPRTGDVIWLERPPAASPYQ